MNSDQAEEFKMNPGKSWKATWAGQLNGDKPFWDQAKCDRSNPKMCPRFHIRGYCFEDCPNEANHVPKERIPSDRKGAMQEYMKKVRRS